MNHTETNEDWAKKCCKLCSQHFLIDVIVEGPKHGYRCVNKSCECHTQEKIIEFCKKLNLREETVSGFDEQAYAINFIRSLRQSDKELILGKMEEKRKECAFNCPGEACEYCLALDTCKSIVEETLK